MQSGQGIYKTELQVIRALAERFLCVVVAVSGSDDTNGRAVLLHTVKGSSFGKLTESGEVFFDYDMAFFRVAGHHDVLCGVLFVGEDVMLDSLSLFNRRA